MKTTDSKSTAPLAAIENAARVIENSGEAPVLAGCGVKRNASPLLAGCGVKQIGQPLLAGCGGDNVVVRHAKGK